MLKNYIKIAWRSLFKNPTTSLINIGGLAMGIAVAILIGLWIWDELSYNKSFENYDRIAQVMTHEIVNGEIKTSSHQVRPLEFELREKYGSSFRHIVMARYPEHRILSYGDKKLTQRGQFMQPGAADMLSLKMAEGNRDGLKDPASILISSSAAKALFGETSAINKAIRIDNRMDVTVAGVYEDLPYSTDFSHLHFLAPWDLLLANEKWIANTRNMWDNHSFIIYAQINPSTSFEAVSNRIQNAVLDNVGEERKKFKTKVFLNPMSRWHLYHRWEDGKNTGGGMRFVRLFGLIGLFVLLLACINFMNLSTARSERRAKEVGVRKAVGSKRAQLVKQFLTESFMVVLLSFLIAVILVFLSLPWFNEIADKKISMNWLNPWFWLISLFFVLGTSLVAGSYPAFYLSSFKPIKVFRGSYRAGRSASAPRHVLVVIQFTISITLIIGTIIVFRQIQHAKDRPLGYSSAGLIGIGIHSSDLMKRFDVFSRELKTSGTAVETALSSSPLTGIWSNNGNFKWKGKAPNFEENFGCIWVSYDYGKTVGWQFKEGRDFSRKFANDVSDFDKPGPTFNIVINESAARYMNMQRPLGEIITWGDQPFRIVGVIKDMVVESPYGKPKQTFFFLNDKEADNWVFIKLNPKLGSSTALARVETTLKKVIPSVPFDYKFVSEEYGEKFAHEERIGKLASVFAFLAIFISCLGLLGLASFVAEQRSKEVSIRKVLGATIFNIWGLLSKEFILLIGVSCLLAFPTAGYFLRKWLEGYEYRTELSWWIFAIAGTCAIAVALVTVSFQTIKAANTNPVKNLKAE